MQGSSEQTLVGEEHCMTTLITAAKETKGLVAQSMVSVNHWLRSCKTYRFLW